MMSRDVEHGSGGRPEVPGARHNSVRRPNDELGANRGMDRLAYEKLSSAIIIFKYCTSRVFVISHLELLVTPPSVGA